MTSGARTLGLLPLPAKAGTPPLLLHAWVVNNPSKPAPQSDEDAPEMLPFHLDFFYQRDSKWRLGTSVSYMGERPRTLFDDPNAIPYEARWLRPRLKEGLIIVEVTKMGSYSVYRLITFSHGLSSKTRVMRRPAQVQESYQDNYGGSSASTITFGVEANGGTTLTNDYGSAGGSTITTYGWRNGRWKEVKKQSKIYEKPLRKK